MEIKSYTYLIALFPFSITACVGPAPDCDRVKRLEVRSVDAGMKAAIFDIQCGATAPDATWILVSQYSKEFDYKTDVVAVFEGDIKGIEWRGHDLHVSYGVANPFKMNSEAAGIQVFYEGTGLQHQ